MSENTIEPIGESSLPVIPHEHDETCNHEEEPQFSQEEIRELIRNFDIEFYLDLMEDRHKIFGAIVNMTNIVFTQNVPTLCVGFRGKTADVVMQINPNFFFKHNMAERIFLLSHEACHVLFDHLKQSERKYGEEAKKEEEESKEEDPFKKDSHNLANIAQDIVINESLLHDFAVPKGQIKEVLKTVMLVETVFTPEEIAEHHIIKNGTWRYYYELIEKLKPDLKKQCCMRDMASGGQPIPDYILDDLLQDALSKLTEEELAELNYDVAKFAEKMFPKGHKRGNNSVGNMISVTKNKRKKRVNWKAILKKHYFRLMKKVEVEMDTFDRVSRRHTLLDRKNIFIPSNNIIEKKLIRKYDVYFFLDVSGSCLNYSQLFYDFARTLPQDYCRIHLFSFDTEVYPIDLKDKTLRGGGGTSFDIIEDYCAMQPVYPALVFVVTDGYGNAVTPLMPKNWVWFLTEGSTDEYIDPLSYKYELAKVFDPESSNVKPSSVPTPAP